MVHGCEDELSVWFSPMKGSVGTHYNMYLEIPLGLLTGCLILTARSRPRLPNNKTWLRHFTGWARPGVTFDYSALGRG